MAANFRPARTQEAMYHAQRVPLLCAVQWPSSFQLDELHTLTSCHPPHRDRSTNHSLARSDLSVLSALWRTQNSISLLVLRLLPVDTYCRTRKAGNDTHQIVVTFSRQLRIVNASSILNDHGGSYQELRWPATVQELNRPKMYISWMIRPYVHE